MRRSRSNMNCKSWTIMLINWRPGKWRWEIWSSGRRVWSGSKNWPNVRDAYIACVETKEDEVYTNSVYEDVA